MQQEKVGITGPRGQSSTQPPSPLINLPGLNDDDTSPAMSLGGGSRRRWGRVAIIAAILLVILLGGFFLIANRRGSRVTYQYDHVTQGNLTITVNATGPIQSGTYNLIFSGSGGKIDEIDVAVGQKVTKGQVLARLDRTSLQDAVNQAQVAVNNARANLNAAIAAANSSGGQSVSSVSAAQTAVSDAQASQAQTKAQGQASVAVAQTTLDNAQTNLAQVTATADAQINEANATYDATNCNPDARTPTVPIPTSTTCQPAQATHDATIAQANESIASAQAQVNSAQAALNQAKANAAANNVTAQNQVNSAQSQLNTAQAGAGVTGTSGQSQVTSAQAQLNTALAQLTQAQHNLALATLKAPHAGIVTIINGTVGGAPGATTGSSTGTTAGTAFIQIVDLSALQAQVNVNEADIANLQVGETATFTVNAYGTQQFTGTVSAIPPTGQTISNVVTYPVQIDIDPGSLKGAHLLPGMTANVTINAVQHNNVLLLPVNAINFARLASSGTSTSGTPQLIPAQTANAVLNQARQMLSNLETANPNLVSEGPIPAFVIEKSGSQYIAKPVVLGLTDGTSYEVLQGLTLSDTFIVGTNG